MRFHHLGLEVSDMDATIAFYNKYAGFVVGNRIRFMGEELVFLELGDMHLEIISSKQGKSKVENAHICFEVANIEEVITHFQQDGRKPEEGPYQLENGWRTVFFLGPDQELIEFLQIDSVSG